MASTLNENFTASTLLLSSEELVLANKKTKLNKVAFAAMLKFFEKELCFPTNNNRPSQELLTTLYKQLIGCESNHFILQDFDWENRSVERFRKEIREYFGFRLFSDEDKKDLEIWLNENAFNEGMRLKRAKRKSFDFFMQNKIQLISQGILDEYVRSSYLEFDKKFLTDVVLKLTENTKIKLLSLITQEEESKETTAELIQLIDLKKDPSGISLKSILIEVKKLNCLKEIRLPEKFLSRCNQKLLKKYYLKVMQTFPSELNKIAENNRCGLISLFCYVAGQRITDNFNELLLQRIRLIETNAESHVEKKVIKKVVKTGGKMDLLLELASIAVAHPCNTIEKAIYPTVSQETLKNLIEELKCRGGWYGYQVKKKMRSLYTHYHRRLLLILIENLNFQSSNPEYDNLLKAVNFINSHPSDDDYYDDAVVNEILTDETIIGKNWKHLVFEDDVKMDGEEKSESRQKINRFYYELAVFDKFSKHLNCKNIWVRGARKYRDPNEDLPKDWKSNKGYYYKILNQPKKAKKFISPIKKLLRESLEMLNKNIPENKQVEIIRKKERSWIKITPSKAQELPKNIELLHREIERRWQSINLLDMLKEADLDIDFTDEMMMEVDKQLMDKNTRQKRMLLVIYGIGTNIGLKPVYKGNPDVSYDDLRYIKRICTESTGIRNAISKVINRLLEIRNPEIWGSDTMSCICDSTLVKVMDQNFVAQWHPRYKEKGIMVYWHVEKGAACIYSQIKTCLSSEVSSMLEGVLRHNTKMTLNKAYMDTHGQSLPGFGFSYLLSVSLLPRLKNIYQQKLYYVETGEEKNYANLALILEEAIDWDLIEEQYDEMMKYAAALKIGTVEAEVIMKRFSKDNYNHPVYKAICELGKSIKTIFLCRYLASEELRIEIHEALNIVERVNGFMNFILFGKLGMLYTNQKEMQEKIILCLHLIEVCLAYVNTLMIQEVLADPFWKNLLTAEDKRALSSLIHGHINPYGLFSLDMDERIPIKAKNKTDHQKTIDKRIKRSKKLETA